jgi:putative transposase
MSILAKEDTTMELKGEVLEKLKEDLAQSKTVEDLLGKDGAIKKLLKRTIEAMLEEEATEHLGYEKHSSQGDHRGNSRNGTSKKTVQTQHGAVELDIPRDREASFEPQVVKKHQRTLGLIEDKILSLYAKGMSTRDIQAHVEEIYGLELSASAISHITDKVMDLVQEWQNRPLEELYVVVYFDAIHYKVRQEGKVTTKAAYTCLAVDREGQRDLLGMWIGE